MATSQVGPELGAQVVTARGTVLARFIGGRADGWVLPVDADKGVLYVTMLAGRPWCYGFDMDIPEAVDLLNRANRRWDFYAPVEGLPADGAGRHGYWHFRSLRPAPRSDPLVPGPEFLEDALAMLTEVKPEEAWAVLEQTLKDAGYGLAEVRELPA
jgi:hypothetical protein